MIVTSDMTVKEALNINEHMLGAFVWLAPEFERLRNPALRKVMAGRVNVEQAARIGRIPLTEALYVLNLAAGEDETALTQELIALNPECFNCRESNPTLKPREILRLQDTDRLVHLVDVMPQAERAEDPQPAILRELNALRSAEEVLLVRHPFDPIPLRDLLERRGYASWAEERRPHEWYIYFFRPHAGAGAAAVRARALGAGAG
ncbi:MAG TPA: DUF2249 domain-containing protein [Pyrinomonadaceae bacterium]|nr:DUF2249 domain-containing protein [Pyrinomonadaceae bacterium]